MKSLSKELRESSEQRRAGDGGSQVLSPAPESAPLPPPHLSLSPLTCLSLPTPGSVH